jgi:fructokinase
MNITELELITGWFSDFRDTKARMELIQNKFNVGTVIVTMGGDGALINFRGKWLHHPGFKVNVSDTIGSGDSFLAAFLSEVSKGSMPEQALLFASGLGALVASKTGGWPEYTINEIHQIIAEQGSAIIH